MSAVLIIYSVIALLGWTFHIIFLQSELKLNYKHASKITVGWIIWPIILFTYSIKFFADGIAELIDD